MATKDTVVQELVVNTLTQAQFDAAKEAGTLSPYELYGTPDTTSEQLKNKLDVGLGNAVAETKTTIVGWGMPDYSAGVELSISDGTITMPFTGFIICKVYNDNDNSVGVYVDGKQILSSSMSYAGVKYWFFNLEKNQTLRIKTAYAMNLAVAFPFKGVN